MVHAEPVKRILEMMSEYALNTVDTNNMHSGRCYNAPKPSITQLQNLNLRLGLAVVGGECAGELLASLASGRRKEVTSRYSDSDISLKYP